MFRKAAAAVMALVILGVGVETAPTERDPLAKLARDPPAPEKSPALNLSRYPRQRLASTGAAGPTKTTAGGLPAGTGAGRWRSSSTGAAGPGKTARMLKMISALEELQRTLNSTLSSRITIVTRAHGRGSGRKNKAQGVARPTTARPVDATAPGASADAAAAAPGLTGRNFRKSLPPQNKKTNKRVCFWKYCSQN